jgi:hypothetical protein
LLRVTRKSFCQPVAWRYTMRSSQARTRTEMRFFSDFCYSDFCARTCTRLEKRDELGECSVLLDGFWPSAHRSSTKQIPRAKLTDTMHWRGLVVVVVVFYVAGFRRVSSCRLRPCTSGFLRVSCTNHARLCLCSRPTDTSLSFGPLRSGILFLGPPTRSGLGCVLVGLCAVVLCLCLPWFPSGTGFHLRLLVPQRWVSAVTHWVSRQGGSACSDYRELFLGVTSFAITVSLEVWPQSSLARITSSVIPELAALHSPARYGKAR